jgi:hypothetical protein
MSKNNNQIDLKNFQNTKKQAEDYYKKIHKIYSPALKNGIFFNSNGFHHLRFDESRKERNKKVQMNKFRCLKNSLEIIKKATTIQEYRRLYKAGKLIEWFGFFAIIDFKNKNQNKSYY